MIKESDRIRETLGTTDSTYKEIISIGNDMVSIYSKDANAEVDYLLKNVDNLSNEEIRKSLLKLSLTAYSFSEVKEKSSLKADIAETLRKERYATEFTKAEGSVALKDTKATLNSSEELLAEMLYSYVANALKTKLDQVHRVVDTLKSILISRQAEAKLLSISGNEEE